MLLVALSPPQPVADRRRTGRIVKPRTFQFNLTEPEYNLHYGLSNPLFWADPRSSRTPRNSADPRDGVPDFHSPQALPGVAVLRVCRLCGGTRPRRLGSALL